MRFSPAPFGAEMQHSGVPLFQVGMDVRTQGDDAPTRVARPIAQQMVKYCTEGTVDDTTILIAPYLVDASNAVAQ